MPDPASAPFEAPPADPEALVDWLEALEGLAPDEQTRRVREARQQATGPAEAYVAVLEARVLGGEADALPVLDAARDAGLDEEAAVAALARLCEARDLQAAWTDWEEVEDRSEVRLRLTVLARVETLDERLAGFLGFFFRASDPELYRWAAHAMGRHLADSPAVREALDAWAAERGLDPAEPARLDGTRNPRRLAFLQAGAAAGPAPDPPVGDARETLAAVLDRDAGDVHPVDHAAALHVAAILAAADACPPGVAADLLDRPFDTRGGPPDERLVDAWASLFAEARGGLPGEASPSHERLDRAWTRTARQCLDEARARDAVGRRVAALGALDRVLAALVHLPREDALALAGGFLEGQGPLEAALVRQRIRAWAARAGPIQPPIPDEAVPEDALADAPDPVRAVVTHRWRARDADGGLLVDVELEGAVALADRLLDLFADKGAWQGASRRTRALALFQLLDLLRNARLPPERLDALLDRHGVTSEAEDPEATHRAARRSAIAHLVARVVEWEGVDGEALLDARTLHEVDDELLLCGFVPTDRRLRTVTTLADALEHRFRWRLRRDAAFRPVAYLARVTVRRPHPSLYEALGDVSRDRAYRRTPEGEGFPLTRVAEDLAAQARRAREGSSAEAVADAWPLDELAEWDPTAGQLLRVREALAGVVAGADPAAAARRLAEVVGRVDARGRPQDGTLLGVLWAMDEPGRPTPRTGDPPWTPDTLQARVERVAEGAARLAALADTLDAEATLSGTRALLEDLRPAVSRVVGLVGDGLPLAETVLLEAQAQRLDALEEDWLAALGVVGDAGELEGTTDAEAWNEVLATVTDRWEGPTRRGIVVRVWRALAGEHVAGVDPADEDAWARGAALVRWGLSADARERWTEAEQAAWDGVVADAYERLLEAAMAADREDRVLPLLREDAYAPARRVETVTETLEAAEDWCLDRYRVAGSLAARRALADVRGARRPSWPGQTVAFLGHFSPVWSALLVGAILMLDFGDAWVELAESGSLLPIGATCVIGVVGAYLYVLRDLDAKVAHPAGRSPRLVRAVLHARAVAFTVVCVLVAAAITGFLWLLLQDTSVVVRGPMAVAHVAVWTAFALFVGIVFGLVIQKGM